MKHAHTRTGAVAATIMVAVFTLGLVHMYPCHASNAQVVADDAALLLSFFRLMIVQQVPSQIGALCADHDDTLAAEAQRWAASWQTEQIAEIRSDLEKTFGTEARDSFAQFVDAFTAAEKKEDPAVLQGLVADLGLPAPVPDDYVGLKGVVLDSMLQEEVATAGRVLGRAQEWLSARKQKTGAPPLVIWMKTQRAQEQTVQTKKPVDSLRAAEAPLLAVDPEADADTGSPLASYGDSRKEKRERKLKEAQEGMDQVAKERAAAEQQFADEKMADATTEAEGRKTQAQKLASSNAAAAKQREKSWGNRLKKIVGGTLSAAGGAIVGPVGGRAGEELAQALFD